MTVVTKDADRTDVVPGVGDRVLASTYPPFGDVLFVDGDGCHLVDETGRQYLDMTSGIAVLALGHRSRVVADALRRAADGLVHTSNLFGTPPAIELAEQLTRRSFADRVFFANSGAEAVEAALKFARLRAGPDRRRIVYFSGSFHGRTLGALAATDREKARTPFGPLPAEYQRAPWGTNAALDFIDEGVAAVIVEPVQGEGGVRPAGGLWLQALRRRCDETGARLVFDEIQCGLGRTGYLWAHEALGVTPDLMTLAKPLAGGLPIGAVLMTEDVARTITPGCHGTTFGGGPAVATVALAVLRAIDDHAFLAEVRRKGALLRAELEAIDHPDIDEVRGRGLMLGVALRRPAAGDVVKAARTAGLLLTSAGDSTIRFLPPLNATDAELRDAAHGFGRALNDARAEGHVHA